MGALWEKMQLLFVGFPAVGITDFEENSRVARKSEILLKLPDP